MYKPYFHSVARNDRQKILLMIDGDIVEARAGDTLLTVLVRHDGHVRDNEFGGGSRSGFCAMGACQDCWVSLASGEKLRACTTIVSTGMNIVRKRISLA